MFGWLKRGSSRPATAVAMIGPRAADAVLFQGSAEPAIAAAVGTVTRLNGRTVVVGEDAAAEGGVTRAADEAGALLEFTAAPLDALPFDAGTFHVVVVPGPSAWPADRRAPRLAEAVRVLLPGGRIIAIDGGGPRGLTGGLAGGLKPAGYDRRLDPDAVTSLLLRAGLVAARKLADAEGTRYYEARKSRE